jgi:hypothetical protein
VLASNSAAATPARLEDDLDIEEFYDQNPQRRTSEEFEFGSDWHDAEGARYELNWIRDTGELYSMREPEEPVVTDPVGDRYVQPMPAKIVTVDVLGNVATLEGVQHLLAGWPDAMDQPNSLQWVRDRLAKHAESSGDPIAPDEQPEELPGAGA